MALREFVDAKGKIWKVWDTLPGIGSVVNPEWKDGWLSFQCGDVRRRLAPIPDAWASASDAELEDYCGRADMARPTPPGIKRL